MGGGTGDPRRVPGGIGPLEGVRGAGELFSSSVRIIVPCLPARLCRLRALSSPTLFLDTELVLAISSCPTGPRQLCGRSLGAADAENRLALWPAGPVGAKPSRGFSTTPRFSNAVIHTCTGQDCGDQYPRFDAESASQRRSRNFCGVRPASLTTPPEVTASTGSCLGIKLYAGKLCVLVRVLPVCGLEVRLDLRNAGQDYRISVGELSDQR
jgi:hypothetical protein